MINKFRELEGPEKFLLGSGLFLLLTIIMMVTYDFSVTKDRQDKLDLYSDKIIKIVEEDGHITNDTLYEIEEFAIANNAKHVKTKGTMDKVSKGENVHVIIEMYDINSKGGEYSNVKAIRSGVAK